MSNDHQTTTRANANAPRSGRRGYHAFQLDPGMKSARVYTLEYQVLLEWTVFGQIFTTSPTPPPGFEPNMEYYHVYGALPAGAQVIRLRYAEVPDTWTPSFTEDFRWAQKADWSPVTSRRGRSTLFVGKSAAGAFALEWNLAQTANGWSGKIAWYSPTASNLFEGVQQDPLALKANTDLPQEIGYCADLIVSPPLRP